jgi:hypothetical protein
MNILLTIVNHKKKEIFLYIASNLYKFLIKWQKKITFPYLS